MRWLLLLWSAQAHAFLGLFVDSYTVPEQRPRTVVVSLHETPEAPAICFGRMDGVTQAFAVLSLSIIPACSTWWDVPLCQIVMLPNMGDRALGHEVRHCYDRDYHGLFGL